MNPKQKVAILGAGTMGPGIATIYALHGSQISMYSRTQKTLDQAKSVLESNLHLFAEENIITQEEVNKALACVEYTTDVAAAVDGAWYIVETIAEKPEPKKELYALLDTLLPEDAIIASNTSYMDIFELMPAVRLPYTLIAHWFAPAHILPLVEIIKGEKTRSSVVDKVMEFHAHCGKQPVKMERFVPGFIINRMQSAMTREVLFLVENGYCTPEEIDLAVKTSLMPRGLMLGLVERMDFNGIDMIANGLMNKKYSPAPAIERPAMIFDHYDRGEFGVKTGKGFYDYSDRPYADTLKERDKQLLKSVRLGEEFMANPLHSKKS